MNLLPIAAAPGFFRNLDAAKWGDIGQATLDTLLMLAGALPLTLLIGLPLGVALFLCGAPQLRRRPVLYGALAAVINLLRSVPFIILMIAMIPLTLMLMGTSLGVRGAILPLVVGAAPFYARLVETALREVDAASSRPARQWARPPASWSGACCCPKRGLASSLAPPSPPSR